MQRTPTDGEMSHITTRSSSATRMTTRRKAVTKDVSTGKATSSRRISKLRDRSSNTSQKQSRVATSGKTKITMKKSRQPVAKIDDKSKDEEEILPKTRKTTTRKKKVTQENKNNSLTKRKTEKLTNISMTSSRQLSLKESFLNQTKSKRLRARRSAKNYCEETVLSDNNSFPSNAGPKKKVPVYKTIPTDEVANSNSEVYEFKYDKDDSREKIRKKKRRPVRQTVVQKLMKARAKQKLREQMATAAAAATETPPDTMENTKKKDIPSQPEGNMQAEVEIPNLETHNLPEDTSPQKIKDIQKPQAKPVIRSIEKLRNEKITLVSNSSPDRDDFKPFRPTDVFKDRTVVQNLNTNNVSLLEKSVSPIIKSSRIFDPGSPWRVPSLLTFSNVRSLYQSTPQKKLDVSTGRLQRVTSDLKNFAKPAKGIESSQKFTEVIGRENIPITSNQKKKVFAPTRRFGTEITNFGQSATFENSNIENREIVNAEPEAPTPNVDSIAMGNNSAQDVSNSNEEIDKENMLNFQTPKKSSTVTIKKKTVAKRSPLKSMENAERSIKKNSGSKPRPFGLHNIKSPLKSMENVQKNSSREDLEPTPGPSGLQNISSPLRSIENMQNNLSEENLEPLPGPSGLQNAKTPEQSKLFRQSNLNNFLNIMDMPESVKIKTPHGIFNDGASCPISNIPSKKTANVDGGVKDAFGFEDDALEENFPSREEQENKENNRNIRNIIRRETLRPTRIIIDQIKNQLTTAKQSEDSVPSKEILKEDVKVQKSPIKKTSAKPQFDIASFSDTFDVLSDAGELPESNSTIGLFADLEPSRFTQPPKRSYKRKRDVKFDFSEDSNSEEEEEVRVKSKKKKVKKLSTQEKKRLEEWVKNVNETFEEIDQYDLVVE